MKKQNKTTFTAIIAFILMLSMTGTSLAHSGRTDSKGGHRDNKNKSGLGYYHFHCGGYPAHMHENGTCPYRTVKSTPTPIPTPTPTPTPVIETTHIQNNLPSIFHMDSKMNFFLKNLDFLSKKQ